jgi:hypothetical protein
VKAVAVARTTSEQRYLLELLQRELDERAESLVADLLQMLENSVEPGLVRSLKLETH